MKKSLTTIILLLASYFLQAQIIVNEVESDAGNFEGSGEWVELKNVGGSAQDMSCWRFTNGGSYMLTIPQGLTLQPGERLLIGNAAKMMCASCDYKFLNTLFTLNPDGYGSGTGAYSNTVFLNTDLLANGGCDCMVGTGSINNGALSGDRLVLYDDAGNIIDALKFSNGDAYGAGAIVTVNFNATNTCPPLPNISVPDVSDPVYNGRTICNDLKGCNSSYARLPDGNNGITVSWAQSGNLSCVGCTDPCGAANNTGSADYPTPGIDNSSNSYTATLNGNAVVNPVSSISICGATPLTFQYQVNHFANVALTATQASGNLGSYVRIGNANPVNFATAGFNAVTGVTTLSVTINPPTGTSNYEFVWGDANTNCVSCPGSNSILVPNDNSSSEKECYVYRKVTVLREDPQGGTPVASCTIPGSITVSGATGTNLQYTLQKQTTAGGPFNTISGPQNGNSFGGIIDDDADPLLPNYQLLVNTVNVTCANPAATVIPVPAGCLGNPACAKYVTSGPGQPTFLPAPNSTVCAGSPLNFTVDITGICNSGVVELLYDYNPAFDPYTQGVSLGSTTTVVGVTPPPTIAGSKVFINEVAPRPQTGICAGTPNGQNANSGEWIELLNAGPAAVDIGGWILSDGDWTATIPAGTLLAPNAYYLIGGGGTLCSVGVLPDLNIETCNCATVAFGSDIMNLTDGNEQVALFDCSGTFIDGVLWDGAAGPVGQALPDAIGNDAPATGCGNYIGTKSVTLPAPALFSDAGAAPSGGVNVGKYRTSANTWVMTTTALNNFTPKAANPGGDWNGAALNFGSQCPPPPVTANITINLPDTCNQASNVDFTVKAIYKPQPVAPCLPNDVIATSNFSIPPCELLTLSGDGDYCDPATAPLTITSSGLLIGNYIINLSNGINNASINPATGGGPFTANVANAGIWTISGVVPPVGSCPPKTTGSANVNILTVPVITASPVSVNACYIYGFDLSSIESQIITSPLTTSFLWYDVPTGGTPISTYINPTVNITYYVSPSTGAPTNCEGSRVPVNIIVDPLPNIPTVVCDGVTATFTQPLPDCFPVACASGVQYSANGLVWSNNNVFTPADPGWSGWGSPANSTLYVRNAASPNCYNYATFINPCSAPLPATMLHFSGKLTRNQTAELKWETTAEKNVSHFEIERSNQNANFVQIGRSAAKGNSAVQQFYTFNDASPYIGMNYYRLKTVDEDGLYTYSNVISLLVQDAKTGIVSVYPNPASNQLQVDINTSAAVNTTLSIVDMLGNTLADMPLKLQKGLNEIPVSVQQFAKGNYFFKIRLNHEMQAYKFTVE
ncbi:MAG: lamin tail domain-containing protein [Chitinophagaceae bacterium]|nr:lamin tail domain-containing protein [Chitinophagaceae bacterium]